MSQGGGAGRRGNTEKARDMKGPGLGLQDYSEGSGEAWRPPKMTQHNKKASQLQVHGCVSQNARVTLSKSWDPFAPRFLIFMKQEKQ